MDNLNKNKIFQLFCFYFKNLLLRDFFMQISTSFFFNFLNQNFWEIFLPTPPAVGLIDDNFLFDFIKNFSLTRLPIKTGSKKGFFLLNIAKKIYFFEKFSKFFLKKELKNLIKKSSQYSVNKFLINLNSIRFLKIQRFFFFSLLFEKIEENLIFKKIGRKKDRDFNMENFLAFDLCTLGSFFFTTNSSLRVRLPLIFWSFFKVNFFKFFQIGGFVLLKKKINKIFFNFLNFFFFYNFDIQSKYLQVLEDTLVQYYLQVSFQVFLKKKINSLKKNLWMHHKFFNEGFLKNLFSFFYFINKIKKRKESLTFFGSSFFPLPFFNMAYDHAKANISLVYRLLYNSFFFFSLENFLIDKAILNTFFYNFFFLSKVKKANFFSFINYSFGIQRSFFFKNRFSIFSPKTLQSCSTKFLINSFTFLPLKSKVFYYNYKYASFFFLSNYRKLYFLSTVSFLNSSSPKENFSIKKVFSYHSLGLLNSSFFSQALFNKVNNNYFFFFSKSLDYFFFVEKFEDTEITAPVLDLTFFIKKKSFYKTFGFFYKTFINFSQKKILCLIFGYFIHRFFSDKFYLVKKKKAYLNFFVNNFFLLQSRRLLLLNFIFKKFFFDDLFFFNRSFFFFDFFHYFTESLFFSLSFDFFPLNFSFLVEKRKKVEKTYLKPVKYFSKVSLCGLTNSFFFVKSKGFIFFLFYFEVLLFIDEFFIWFFCFKTRVIKKKHFFKWNRVFFCKPFFFDKKFPKIFYSLQMQQAFFSFFSRSFNFLYNKKLIKQKGIFLKFFLLKKKLLLFFDNLFWYLVPAHQFNKLTIIKKNKRFFNDCFFKNNNFFLPFFFQEKILNVYGAIPAFMKKLHSKIFIEFFYKKTGSFFDSKKFFFFDNNFEFFKNKKLDTFFFFDFFFKRIFFLENLVHHSLKTHSFFLQWFRLNFSLDLNYLLNTGVFAEATNFAKKVVAAKFFVKKFSQKKIAFFKAVLKRQRTSTRTTLEPDFHFFLRYFYNHKIPVNNNSLIFLRYFNEMLQKISLQKARDFSCSFLKFFWKFGRKFWYLRIERNFYLWDSLKKSWILFSKKFPFNFFFSQPVSLLLNDIFLARTHFKIFNSSVFNQFFSFSIIKRWTPLKFLYRMQDFLEHLSVHRGFIGRGLSLNYKSIKLANSFFGTSFFFNSLGFYSFNKILVDAFLYNVKPVFYLTFYSIFSIAFILKIFRSKQFFSIYFFLPVFSRKLFSLIHHFKSISKTLFFFNHFFVRGTVNGFFCHYFAAINPFCKRNNYSFFFPMESYKSLFCSLLFVDYRARSFFSKFFSARMNFLLKFKK